MPESELEIVDMPTGTIPDIHMEDSEVEGTQFDYSIRAPGDWVSSGPLGSEGVGSGRRFSSWEIADKWARDFYGPRLKGRIKEAQFDGGNRWAFLIRGPRGVIGY